MPRLVWLIGLIALLLAAASGAQAQLATFTATPIQTATITIPTAQILTAKTTAVAVLPTPPAGSAYMLLGVTAVLNYKSATYSSTACGLYFHGTTQLALSANLNTTVDGAASVVAQISGLATGAIAIANVTGLGVDFACTTGDPTTGDSGLKLDLAYVQVPL